MSARKLGGEKKVSQEEFVRSLRRLEVQKQLDEVTCRIEAAKKELELLEARKDAINSILAEPEYRRR